MASARLLKSLIKPVLQRHPNVIFFDNMLFFQPIGWYLRGCMFGRSSWTGAAKFAFVNRFVLPLFEPRIRGVLGWGGRLRTRAGSEAWYVEDNFTAEFEWAFENEIAAHVEAISTGEDFKIYIGKKLDFTSWGEYAVAMACLHMGQLAEAKKLLQKLVEECEQLRISQQAFGFANARNLLPYLETDPFGLEAKLIAPAVQTAENFKITKFWAQPEKFWDKPPQLP
ncbi:MAG: hypothetical protein ACLPOA_23030 [Methylocella sp.]|jgi:hypothetical protein